MNIGVIRRVKNDELAANRIHHADGSDQASPRHAAPCHKARAVLARLYRLVQRLSPCRACFDVAGASLSTFELTYACSAHSIISSTCSGPAPPSFVCPAIRTQMSAGVRSLARDEIFDLKGNMSCDAYSFPQYGEHGWWYVFPRATHTYDEQIRTYAHAHAHTHTHTHTDHTHTRTLTYTYTRTGTHTHRRTHAHTPGHRMRKVVACLRGTASRGLPASATAPATLVSAAALVLSRSARGRGRTGYAPSPNMEYPA